MWADFRRAQQTDSREAALDRAGSGEQSNAAESIAGLHPYPYDFAAGSAKQEYQNGKGNFVSRFFRALAKTLRHLP